MAEGFGGRVNPCESVQGGCVVLEEQQERKNKIICQKKNDSDQYWTGNDINEYEREKAGDLFVTLC